MAIQTKGSCLLCNQEITHRASSQHIKKCIEKNPNSLTNPKKQENIFLIKISAYETFWLYLEINAKARLLDLDAFLRDLWLECCGHLSMFMVGRDVYDDEDNLISLPIQDVLSVGTKFSYLYDFGSTTDLEGEVLSARPGQIKNKIRLLARNVIPQFTCSVCKNTSPDFICDFCRETYCQQCHVECDGEEPDGLPIVNSPRMGICAYTGED